jgi:MFS transporter, ACS family, tartrate transporter
MDDSVPRSAMRKISIRLIPFVCLLYAASYVDRVNVSFASLTMNKDIGISNSAFGLAASLFFVGYFAFEVPSNLILTKVGARPWIARILITWGLLSAATMFASGENSFYILRLLLGIAEAGFFPAIVMYLSSWLPSAYRARMMGLFMIAMPLSSVIGAPVSTLILVHLQGAAGLAGWRWLYLIEGIPTVLLGIASIWLMPDRPAKASWLGPKERDWLEETLQRERQETERLGGHRLLAGFTNPRVLVLSVLFFAVLCGVNGISFWIPQIISSLGFSTETVGLLTAVPFLGAVVAMILWPRHSDLSGDRTWHIVISTWVAAAGFLVAGLALGIPELALIGLSAACIGAFSTLPVFWTLPTALLGGTAGAVAVALINSLGNLSGIVAPAFIGWSKDATGHYELAMIGLAGIVFVAGVLAIFIRQRRPTMESAVSDAALP